MAVPQAYQSTMFLDLTEPQNHLSGVSQLFAAAVVNQQFCHLLLKDPRSALQQGYGGDEFNLTSEEQTVITAVKAESLSDFALKVTTGLGH